MNLLQMPGNTGKDKEIYQAFMIGTAWVYNFYPTQRTLSQLRSEGYHLIRKKNAANTISQLEADYELFNFQSKNYTQNLQNDIDLAASSFADGVITEQVATVAFKNVTDNGSIAVQLSDIPESATIKLDNKDDIKTYTDKLKRYSFFLHYSIKGQQLVLQREI